MFLEKIETEKNDYFIIIKRLFAKKIGQKLKFKLLKPKDMQRHLTELGIILFLLQLDMPAFLTEKLTIESRMLQLTTVLSMTFEIKEFLAYTTELPDELFQNDKLLDFAMVQNLPLSLGKNLFFGLWYLLQVLRNFKTIKEKINSNSTAKETTEILGKLFEVNKLNDPSFEFSESLSSIIEELEMNEIQQLFLFVKIKFNKNKNKSRRSYQRYSKKIYFFSKNGKLTHMHLNSRILNKNYFKQFVSADKLSNNSLRKMKRHQEICIFIGLRIKNYIIRRSLDEGKKTKMFFKIIQTDYDRVLENLPKSRKNKIFKKEKLENLLNSRLLSSYKIPVHLFKSMMCTKQYESFANDFFKMEYLADELDYFFERDIFPKKLSDSSVAYYLEQIFLPHHKIKLPWTMIELLNVIPYILNLDKGIDLHHLESSSKKLK